MLRGVALVVGLALVVVGLLTGDGAAQSPALFFGIALSTVPLLTVCSDILPSPLLRAHLALVLGWRDALDTAARKAIDSAARCDDVRTHALHCSWWTAPPLRALAGDGRGVRPAARVSSFQPGSGAAPVHPEGSVAT